ncbi:MAG: hypothetical protein ACXACD_11490, partial [Candidatus Thorarchaeota archaeon]
TVFAVVHVSTPVELAVQWNKNRENPVPNGVIEKIAERLDVPGSKYAWDRPIATHNLGMDDPKKVGSEIAERISSLASISDEARSSDKLVGDLLDVITRQVVKEFLDENPSMRKNPLVSKERRDFLRHAMKQGFSPFETEQQFRARLGELASAQGKNSK